MKHRIFQIQTIIQILFHTITLDTNALSDHVLPHRREYRANFIEPVPACSSLSCQISDMFVKTNFTCLSVKIIFKVKSNFNLCKVDYDNKT